MDPAVEAWLVDKELPELVPLFTSQKLVSFRRIKALTEPLVKEIISEVGTRIDFLECLSQLKEGDSPTPTSIGSKVVDSPTPSSTLIRSQIFDSPTRISTFQPDSEITVLGIVQVGEQSTNPVSTDVCRTSDDSFDDDDYADKDYCPSPKKKSKLLVSSRVTSTPRQAGSSNVKRKGHLVTSTPRHILSFAALETIRNLDLKVIIEKDLFSSYVLDKYERCGGLASADRTAVVHAAAAWMQGNLQVIGAAEYQLMADKICEIFPDEKPGLYFSPPDTEHKNFGGKLPDRVRNVKYLISKRGGASSISKAVSVPKNSAKYTEPAEVAGSCDRCQPELRDAINALNHESLDSWPLILSHWSTTHALRRKSIIDSRSAETDTYLDELEWEVLKASNGHLLLCQDFKELFPAKKSLI